MATEYLKRFTFVGSGIWINEADNVSVMFDEQYRRTFRAYRWRRPEHKHVVTSPSGRVTRFRTAEAAARHLLKTKTETGAR